MHVPPEHEQRPLREEPAVGLKTDQAVGERHVGGLAPIHCRSPDKVRALALVQQDVARPQAVLLEDSREVHLLEIGCVDAVLEDVGHPQVWAHLRAVMPLGMPLAAKLDIADIPHCRPGPSCRKPRQPVRARLRRFSRSASAVPYAGRIPFTLRALRDDRPVGSRTPAGGHTSAHAPSSLSNSSTSLPGSHRLSLKASTKAP